MNASGSHQPALGVLPAYEGLEPTHLAARDGHLRLVVQDELVAVEPLEQLPSQRQPLLDRLGQAPLEEADAAGPVGLRAVHGQVGLAQEVRRARLVAGQRDPERRGEMDLLLGAAVGWRQRDGLLRQRVQDPPGRRRRGRRVVHLQQDAELVAAQPRDRVLRAHHLRQSVGRGDQELVAGLVPHRVVDGVEVVEVQEEHRQGDVVPAVTLAATAGEGLLQPVQQQRAVGQPREPGFRSAVVARGMRLGG